MDRVINTPLALKGSPKQIAWAESIRKKAMAFVRENQDAIDALAREKHADMHKRGKAVKNVKLYTAHFLLITMGCANSAKIWIEKHRNGVKTVKEAVELIYDTLAFHEPLTIGEKMKLADREWYCRMEAAKERMQGTYCPV